MAGRLPYRQSPDRRARQPERNDIESNVMRQRRCAYSERR
ncbi:flagellar motor protein MotA [Burkholderia pseudomallei]|nr:flagellar motor protein MotA [Burkholderia pseudomallei]